MSASEPTLLGLLEGEATYLEASARHFENAGGAGADIREDLIRRAARLRAAAGRLRWEMERERASDRVVVDDAWEMLMRINGGPLPGETPR